MVRIAASVLLFVVAWPSMADACSCGQPQPCLAVSMATVVFVGVKGFLVAGLCSGTLPLDLAKPYLDYLERPPSKPEVGRVSGLVYFETREPGWKVKLPPVKVVVRGDQFTREATTNADGRFEFVDVPAKRFTVAAEPPAPFIATRNVVHDSPDPRQCTFAALPLRYDGRIAGLLRDNAGAPVPNQRVQARRPDGYEALEEVTTDPSGKYALTGLSPGKYLVGVNIARPPTAQSPFEATSRAAILLAAGQHLDDVAVRLPRPLATIELRGCASWPDNTPVRDGWVQVESTRDQGRGAHHQQIDLDASGCFLVPAIEGNRYTLRVHALLPPAWPVTIAMSEQTVDAIRTTTRWSFVLIPPRARR